MKLFLLADLLLLLIFLLVYYDFSDLVLLFSVIFYYALKILFMFSTGLNLLDNLVVDGEMEWLGDE